MKDICLVVVIGGVAYEYAPEHVDCQIIDLDNAKDGSETTMLTLPHGVGFEVLADQAGLEAGTDFTWSRL